MPDPIATTPAAPAGVAESVRSTLGWIAAMAVVACAGWGVVYLDWYLVKHFKLADPGFSAKSGVFLGAGWAMTFLFFFLLERNFWLSRTAGLKVHPNASPLWSATLYWLFGVPGMLVRSAVGSPPQEEKKTTPQPTGHAVREAFETVVFVVVLVFLLKQFVVEAFVIPTGSMATTLYGYQKIVTCPECHYEFPLNASDEVSPSGGGPKRPIEGYCCPNCRYKAVFGAGNPSPHPGSGDRVLVHKVLQHLIPPRPGDVVVFKYPEAPQKQFEAQNYIKRMWGVGGDTIAIWRGDLYVCKSLKYPPPPEGTRPEDLWDRHFTNTNDGEAVKLFEESRKAGFPVDKGGFELIRKSDEIALAMRRIVFDNDQQSRKLAAANVPPRWKEETNDWTADDAKLPKAFTHSGTGLGWVRYRHVVADWPMVGEKTTFEQRPVDNFLGYNAEITQHGEFRLDRGAEDYKFWVGDLMVECRAKITDPAAGVTLELSKGESRFQAVFSEGKVTLVRTGPHGKGLGSWPAPVSGPGTYDLRFANIDCRLRVWVDGTAVPLGPEADYAPSGPESFDAADAKKEGWTAANDVAAPASVGATGGVEVSKLKLWRDSFFINSHFAYTGDATATVHTYYVQPGHYLCLGDNSAQSSDGRDWGTVPERLMLGRAVFIFFPLDRIGFIK